MLEKKIFYIVDVVCPFDPRKERKEKNKVKNYTDLKYILKMWKNEVTLLQVYIGLHCLHCSNSNWCFRDGFEKYKQIF